MFCKGVARQGACCPRGSDSKESAYKARDLGSIPGLGRSPGEGNGSHSNITAWRIPRTEESGGLQSMGSQTVGHNVHPPFTISPLLTYHLLVLELPNSKQVARDLSGDVAGSKAGIPEQRLLKAFTLLERF